MNRSTAYRSHSADVGLVDVARRAGIQQAIPAVIVTSPAAITTVPACPASSPKDRMQTIVAPRPIASPSATVTNAWRKINAKPAPASRRWPFEFQFPAFAASGVRNYAIHAGCGHDQCQTTGNGEQQRDPSPVRDRIGDQFPHRRAQ